MAVIKESDVGVDVAAAPSTSADNLVLDDWNRRLVFVERCVGLDGEGEGQLRLLQKAVCCRNAIEGGSDVGRWAIRIWQS